MATGTLSFRRREDPVTDLCQCFLGVNVCAKPKVLQISGLFLVFLRKIQHLLRGWDLGAKQRIQNRKRAKMPTNKQLDCSRSSSPTETTHSWEKWKGLVLLQ